MCNSIAENREINIYNYDFSGFSMNDSYTEVEKKLKNLGIQYKTSKIGIFSGAVQMDLIEALGNSGENKISSFKFFKNEMIDLIQYDISKNYLKELVRIFGKNYATIKDIKVKYLITEYKWTKDDFDIFFRLIQGTYQLIIHNKKNQKLVDKELIKAEKFYSYISPNVSKLKLRRTPDLESGLLKILVVNDKLEFIEGGRYEKIDGKPGQWIKVKTINGEIGWCFDAYCDYIE